MKMKKPFAMRLALGLMGLSTAAQPALAAEDAGESARAALAATQMEAASEAGEAELRMLTNQVLKSLNAVTSGDGKKKESAEPAPGDYEALMQALTTLVDKATRQGKTSKDILALIEEALAEKDEATLMALIERAGGKVELQNLLRALVRKAALETQASDPYTRMLKQESESTRVVAAARQRAESSAPRGGRVITVRPGDTLGTLALQHYGSSRRWRDIYEANRDVLKSPDLVPAGIRLRLP